MKYFGNEGEASTPVTVFDPDVDVRSDQRVCRIVRKYSTYDTELAKIEVVHSPATLLT